MFVIGIEFALSNFKRAIDIVKIVQIFNIYWQLELKILNER